MLSSHDRSGRAHFTLSASHFGILPALAAMLLAVATAPTAQAADIVFQQSVLDGSNYDWSNPANWVGGVLPGSSDQADIGNGFTATINSGSNDINSLFLGADSAAGTTGDGTLNQTA